MCFFLHSRPQSLRFFWSRKPENEWLWGRECYYWFLFFPVRPLVPFLEYLMRSFQLSKTVQPFRFAQNWKISRFITTPCRIVSTSTKCWTNFFFFLHGSLSDFTINRYMLSRLVHAESAVGTSTISIQFRRIEFWLIQPKQPFEISISRIYFKKSLSALHFEK